MGVSQYANLAEYKPVNDQVSQYVEMPFQEINYALASKQKKKDDEFADVNAKANALGIESLAEHNPSREAFVQEYNTEFMNLLESGIDPSTGEFTRLKKGIIDKLQKDRRPGTYKRAIESRKKDTENIEEHKKAGTYRGYNNATYWQNGSPLDEQGNPNELIYEGAFAGEDHNAFWHKIFEQQKANAVKSGGITGIDPTSGMITYRSSADKGVFESTLLQTIEAYDNNGNKKVDNITNYLGDSTGQDFIRFLRGAKSNITEEEIRESTKQKARSLMQSYLYGESESDNKLTFMPGHAVDANIQAQLDSQAPVTFDPATPNAYQGDVINMHFDNNGNVVEAKKYFNNGKEISYQDYQDLSRSANYGATQGLSIQTDSEQNSKNNYAVKALRQADQEIYGNQKDYKARTDKELVEDQKEAIKNSALYVPYNKNFIGKKGDLITEQKLGGSNTIQNLFGQKLQLLGAEGGGQLNFNELETKVGKTLQTRVQGRSLNNPDMPGGMVVSIKGEDGKTTKVTVGADKVTERFFSQYTPVFIDALAGKSGRHELGDTVIKTHTTPKKKGTYNIDRGESAFITKVEMITPGGTEKMSLEEFEERVNNKYEEKYPLLHTAAFETNKEEADIVEDDSDNQ